MRESERRIGHDEARAIAKAHVAEARPSEDSASVAAVHETVMEHLNIYGSEEWPERCWVAYLSPGAPGVIRGREVIVISMETGEVLYVGSVCDEG